jgi:hypothetical protein
MNSLKKCLKQIGFNEYKHNIYVLKNFFYLKTATVKVKEDKVYLIGELYLNAIRYENDSIVVSKEFVEDLSEEDLKEGLMFAFRKIEREILNNFINNYNLYN